MERSFLQYLWGIETPLLTKIQMYYLRFYSTYEELKPLKIYADITICKCFYSTYEELKQPVTSFKVSYSFKVFTVPMRNWNDYMPMALATKQFSFTVPMRNWNYLLWIQHLQDMPVLQYLWGIETLLYNFWNFSRTLFLQYLWGIETWWSLCIVQMLQKFLQYLWGIETGKQIKDRERYRRFYSTYEIETLKADLSNIWESFTVPMRNWNSK